MLTPEPESDRVEVQRAGYVTGNAIVTLASVMALLACSMHVRQHSPRFSSVLFCRDCRRKGINQYRSSWSA